MTTELETAARAEAGRRLFAGTEVRAHVEGWEAARDHLAAQEETEEEVRAATKAGIEAGLWCGEHDLGPDEDCPDCWQDASVIAAAVLAAARRTRQEKR